MLMKLNKGALTLLHEVQVPGAALARLAGLVRLHLLALQHAAGSDLSLPPPPPPHHHIGGISDGAVR